MFHKTLVSNLFEEKDNYKHGPHFLKQSYYSSFINRELLSLKRP